MYRIGICDDNIGVCTEIETYLLQYKKEEGCKLEVEVFLSGADLKKALESGNGLFHLLFLDIELGDTDGIAVGSLLRERMENEVTQIVYISYKQTYAMQLFKIRPMDFLLKPIDYQKVRTVMNTCRRLFPDKKQFFEYRKDRKLCQTAQSEIICFQCDGKKIRLVTIQKNIEFYGKMADVWKQLNPAKFWTIHKSYIINVDYAVEFSTDKIEMINGEILPVSKAYKKEIKDKLLDWTLIRRS